MTGEGLDRAFAAADVVVDVSNSPSFADNEVLRFFETSTGNILKAADEAGIRHYVALSVVGSDRVPDSGYLRAKLAQERSISSGPIPWTIVRATQFFEFLGAIAQSGAEGDIIYLSPAKFQPIASADVAMALLHVCLAPPENGVVELAGPDAFSMAKLVQRYLVATGDVRKVVPDADARYFGALLNDRSLMPGVNPRLGATSFAQWVEKAVPGG